jgi:hypothetical protein
MAEGKKIRVKVKTVNASYEGSLHIPPMRNRVSDVLNDEEKTFINLTDVTIHGSTDTVAFVSINKNMIESVLE